MTEKRFTLEDIGFVYDNGELIGMKEIVDRLNALHEENEYLKIRFKEERELAMKISRECDALTIKKQELELEIIRLETIIRTGKKRNDEND